MRKLTFSLLLIAAGLQAGPITFTVNTSSLNGTTGSLDFLLNAGIGTYQAATATISGIATDGTYVPSSQLDFGAVTGGPIPSTITIQNTSLDNEDFENFVFGNFFTFTLNLTGPAVVSPNGTSNQTSTFDFSIYSDVNGTVPALGSNSNGVAAGVTINLDGTRTTQVISPDVTVTPEPATMSLVGSVLLLAGALRLRRK